MSQIKLIRKDGTGITMEIDGPIPVSELFDILKQEFKKYYPHELVADRHIVHLEWTHDKEQIE